jgi:hypothetical protein
MHSCLVALCGAGALARESADPTIPPGNFAPCFTAVTKDGKPKPWFRIGLIAILTFALSGWTCSAIVGFQSCLAVGQTPQITSLSPNAMSANATSVLLIVIGNNFVPQSQILWNGNTLVTTFVDSQHLQATITQQTFTQFGGSLGSNVLISVTTPASATAVGCPIPGSSATLVLAIN